MIIGLYGFLLLICLVLIVIGLFKPDESAYAIIGFLFLFILSIIMLNGQVEIETGANTSSSFSYDATGTLIGHNQNIVYSYQEWNDTTSHRIGYWLVVISVLGFVGVLFTIDKVKSFFRRDKDDED